VTELIRAYRVGQTRFIGQCIHELLERSAGDHNEGLAILAMVETISEYVDDVVEEVVSAHAHAREGWVRDRSAVHAIQVREVLNGTPRDLAAAERALDYRMDRDHVGLVLWTAKRDEPDPLARVRSLVSALLHLLAVSAPLVVPADESTAWAWLPSTASLARSEALATAMRDERHVSIAVGQPGSGIEGFRRTHQQALSARLVALAAGEQHVALTPFVDVAPIATLCADLESARVWVHETLGDLAIDSARNEALRETARVFLQTGGSYTATAEQLFVHRNTAQYRIRKAEAIRGRPLRDSRLDVELALLACQWMKGAVLWSANESNDARRDNVSVARS
jgi:DNA-binding PucR family transcriptional regulator